MQQLTRGKMIGALALATCLITVCASGCSHSDGTAESTPFVGPAPVAQLTTAQAQTTYQNSYKATSVPAPGAGGYSGGGQYTGGKSGGEYGGKP